MMGLDQIRQKQKERPEVLKTVYEVSEESGNISIIDPDVLSKHMNMDRDKLDSILKYLEGEELIEVVALGGYFTITHQGSVEVESFIENPERGTQHFKF